MKKPSKVDQIGGQNLYVSRTGFTGELGFEIYSHGDNTDHLKLWDHLIKCGGPHGMELGSTQAMNIRRVEAGILGNTVDMDMSITPFQAGLSQFVDLEKEGFIGRKALLECDKRAILYGLTCLTAIPTAGGRIFVDNKEVGYITTGFNLPTLRVGIGYARFYQPYNFKENSMVLLRLVDGSYHENNIVALPFFDAEKKVVRGVDRNIP